MLAIISGSGTLPLASGGRPLALPALRWGMPSGHPVEIDVAGTRVVLLARHGVPHRVAPHRINYRANLELLAALGATRVLALTTVGGISLDAAVGRLIVPHQIIDYTWGRAHSFVEDEPVEHVDFDEPFDRDLRAAVIRTARTIELDVGEHGVYGCTQGPRFETIAEIERMARDGCTLVGMTGMPEAGLARELRLPYAMVSLVVNPAAGRAADPFNRDAISRVMAAGMRSVDQLLRAFLQQAD